MVNYAKMQGSSAIIVLALGSLTLNRVREIEREREREREKERGREE